MARSATLWHYRHGFTPVPRNSAEPKDTILISTAQAYIDFFNGEAAMAIHLRPIDERKGHKANEPRRPARRPVSSPLSFVARTGQQIAASTAAGALTKTRKESSRE